MEVQEDTVNRLGLPVVGSELVQCPNCALQLQPKDMAQHCEEEMDHLKRMQLPAQEEQSAEHSDGTEEQRKPWTVFQKVQRNRHTRLRQRTRKRPVASTSTTMERACPVCNKQFAQDEIERHVEVCLKRAKTNNGQNGYTSSDEDEVTEEYEEYEWAGQKRIRVSTMLPGGYAAIGIGQSTTTSNGSAHQQQTDEDEDLNVDEDDTHIYGPPQYGENDIIPPQSDDRALTGNEEYDISNYMRKLITAGSSQSDERDKVLDAGQTTSKALSEPTTSNGVCTKKLKFNVYEQIIESLKAKLRQYEQQQQGKFKCLICLDEYKNPAISVSCWHVHCEDCWLRSLGVRKLCPQCNLITTPKDLRRIYM